MGRPHTVVHRFTYDNTLRWNEHVDAEIIRALSASIISQAVEDWIGLIHYNDYCKTHTDAKQRLNYRQVRCGNAEFSQLRRFFTSDYGETLCEMTDVNPRAILQQMERWKTAYEEDGVLPKFIHQLPERTGRRKHRRV